MALDFSKMWMLAPENPTIKKDISRWLDQTFKAPFDVTNGKIYYDGVMGSTKLEVLSNMEKIGANTPNPRGGCYHEANFYRIVVLFKTLPYEVVFENVPMMLGQQKVMYYGKQVPSYMGYVVAGIRQSVLSANVGASMVEMLWN